MDVLLRDDAPYALFRLDIGGTRAVEQGAAVRDS